MDTESYFKETEAEFVKIMKNHRGLEPNALVYMVEDCCELELYSKGSFYTILGAKREYPMALATCRQALDSYDYKCVDDKQRKILLNLKKNWKILVKEMTPEKEFSEDTCRLLVFIKNYLIDSGTLCFPKDEDSPGAVLKKIAE